MKLFERYILINPEKYKASWKQSMATGKFFFEVSVYAETEKELLESSKNVLQGLIKIANEMNKEENKKRVVKEKKPEVKGLE